MKTGLTKMHGPLPSGYNNQTISGWEKLFPEHVKTTEETEEIRGNQREATEILRGRSFITSWKGGYFFLGVRDTFQYHFQAGVHFLTQGRVYF